jgi:hypothetical protein
MWSAARRALRAQTDQFSNFALDSQTIFQKRFVDKLTILTK